MGTFIGVLLASLGLVGLFLYGLYERQVPGLVEKTKEKAKGFSDKVKSAFRLPGNVRQLKEVVIRPAQKVVIEYHRPSHVRKEFVIVRLVSYTIPGETRMVEVGANQPAKPASVPQNQKLPVKQNGGKPAQPQFKGKGK